MLRSPFLPAAWNGTAVTSICMSIMLMSMWMCMPPRVREDGGLAA